MSFRATEPALLPSSKASQPLIADSLFDVGTFALAKEGTEIISIVLWL